MEPSTSAGAVAARDEEADKQQRPTKRRRKSTSAAASDARPSTSSSATRAGASAADENMTPEDFTREKRSCRECARMKIKCSKETWPCESCVRRGCAGLCPTGTLTKGTRSYLARIEQSAQGHAHAFGDSSLSAALEERWVLAARVEQLETALRRAHLPIPPKVWTTFKSTRASPNAAAARALASDPNSPAVASTSASQWRPRVKSEPASDLLPEASGTLFVDASGAQRYHSSDASSAFLLGGGGGHDDEHGDGAFPGLPPTGQHGAHPYMSDLSADERFVIGLVSGGGGGDATPAASSSTLPRQAEPHDFVRDREELTKELLDLAGGREVAQRLTRLYFDIGTITYEPVAEETFMDLLGILYAAPLALSYVQIALVAAVLALGCIFEPTTPSSAQTARRLFTLARTAYDVPPSSSGLSKSTGVNEQSIQAGMLLCHYVLYSSRMSSMYSAAPSHTSLHPEEEDVGDESYEAWMRLGRTMRLISVMGLHRDATSWGIKDCELEERRRTFWEAQVFDRMQAMCFGRPLSLPDIHCDCKFPSIDIAIPPPLPDESPASAAFTKAGWHHFKYRWASLIGDVIDGAMSVSPPVRYSTILELDKRLQDFLDALPHWMRDPHVEKRANLAHIVAPPPRTSAEEQESVRHDTRRFHVVMKQHSFAVITSLTILYLHRRACTVALVAASSSSSATTKDPLKGPFATSVRRASEAASRLIAVTERVWHDYPAMAVKTWYFCFHAFSAAILQAFIAIRAPTCEVAQAARDDLLAATALFERIDTSRSKRRAALLQRLCQRALVSSRVQQSSEHTAGGEDTLPGLVGATSRLVMRAASSSRSPQAGHVPLSTPTPPSAYFDPSFLSAIDAQTQTPPMLYGGGQAAFTPVESGGLDLNWDFVELTGGVSGAGASNEDHAANPISDEWWQLLNQC